MHCSLTHDLSEPVRIQKEEAQLSSHSFSIQWFILRVKVSKTLPISKMKANVKISSQIHIRQHVQNMRIQSAPCVYFTTCALWHLVNLRMTSRKHVSEDSHCPMVLLIATDIWYQESMPSQSLSIITNLCPSFIQLWLVASCKLVDVLGSLHRKELGFHVCVLPWQSNVVLGDTVVTFRKPGLRTFSALCLSPHWDTWHQSSQWMQWGSLVCEEPWWPMGFFPHLIHMA